MKINEMQAKVHELAKTKGWWDDDPKDTRSVLAKLALIHSEVSEAVEEARSGLYDVYYPDSKLRQDGKPEGMVIELADAVIRIADLCQALGLDLQGAIERKHEYNATRAHRHGGKLA